MAIKDYKITERDIESKGVVAAPDVLIGNAKQNKMVFDRLIRETVKGLFNGLIDALADASGAGEIGALVEGLSGQSVQELLTSMKGLLDTKAPSADMEAALGLKEDKAVTDTHVKEVEFDAETGKFKFIKQSGAFFEIDTALEKIATNWTYDPETQSIVLTLIDGTTQRVSLSDFITATEFVSSESIAFSVSGSTVTASVQPGSVTDSMLSSALLQMMQEYVSQTAENAATAWQAKNEASHAAQSVKENADAAKAAAAAAAESEKDAEAAALEARYYAETGKNGQTAGFNFSGDFAIGAEYTGAAIVPGTLEIGRRYTQSMVWTHVVSGSTVVDRYSEEVVYDGNEITLVVDDAQIEVFRVRPVENGQIEIMFRRNIRTDSASYLIRAVDREEYASPMQSAIAADEARKAAEKARDEAQAAVGGDFVTETELNEAIAAIPKPESDVFIAEYGVTTIEEIEDAFAAGKFVCVKYDDGEARGYLTICAEQIARFALTFAWDAGSEDPATGMQNAEVSELFLVCTPEGWREENSTHASRHWQGGSDPIDPNMIGAVSAEYLQGEMQWLMNYAKDRVDEHNEAEDAHPLMQEALVTKASVHSGMYTLPASGWSGGMMQELQIESAYDDSVVIASPRDFSADQEAWTKFGVYCRESVGEPGYSRNRLRFVCATTPDVDIVVNILIIN